ncbi:hypothetical protein HIJ39_23030 [Sulfobacillus sp. DSM 109850]|uniref:Restriction endonuclease type IV Mrr domain-containing protein n=2 Tax=Sulfobacillus harzensis TaxID=2729629 RepID=A0A7Y0L8B8_9FIRM|nr:hypothetical protein [Sulfobacillus harzensis]
MSADLSALYTDDVGKLVGLTIEIKTHTTYIASFIRGLTQQLSRLSKINPQNRIVLALPGVLPPPYVRLLPSNVWLWDLPTIANLFSQQIHLVNHRGLREALAQAALNRITVEDQLLAKLGACALGKQSWAQYQNVVGEIFEFLFCPPLGPVYKEYRDSAGINRRDLIIANYAEEGFWAFVRQRYDADYVIVEAKNYKSPVGKSSVLQVGNYLKKYGAGLFGLVVSRRGADRSALLTAQHLWVADSKLVMFLDDRDLEAMLLVRKNNGIPHEVVRQKIQEFRLAL